MKLFKDGKEVKGAVIRYGADSKPSKVMVRGAKTWHPAGDFTFDDEPTEVKLKSVYEPKEEDGKRNKSTDDTKKK